MSRSSSLIRRLPVFPAIVLSLAFAACSGGERAPSEEASVSFQLEPDLVLGVLEGPEEATFGRIGGLLGDDQGRIYVLDNQASAIRVFDNTGAYQFSIGRPGAGPGELAGPCCMAWAPSGMLWVRDGGNGRYSGFQVTDDSAEFEEVVRFAHGDVNLWTETTLSAAGQLIDVGTRPTGSRSGSERARFFLSRTGQVDSVQIVESPPPQALGMQTVIRELPGGGQAKLYFYPPFGPRHLVAHGSGGVWAEALSSEAHIELHKPDGTSAIRLPVTVGPELSPAERDRAQAQITADIRRSGSSSLDLEVPQTKPPIQDLFFDDTGQLWVELSVPDGSMRRARIYGADGNLRAEATWPGDINLSTPMAWPGNGAWSLGIQTDSLGVQRVVRLVHQAS